MTYCMKELLRISLSYRALKFSAMNNKFNLLFRLIYAYLLLLSL